MTAAWSIAALGISACALLLLGLGDPKRRRVSGLAPVADRRLPLLALLLAPGIALAVSGQTAAFMIWLGGNVLAGWAVAGLLALRR